MKRNVKKILVLIVLGLVGFNSAFGCDIKVNGKWYEDVPCCMAKQQMYQSFERCDKLSLEDFNRANELRKDMTKLMIQLGASKEVEKRASIIEEFNAFDKELKDITGLSYGEVFKKCLIK